MIFLERPINDKICTNPVETNPIPAVRLVVLHHVYTQTILRGKKKTKIQKKRTQYDVSIVDLIFL